MSLPPIKKDENKNPSSIQVPNQAPQVKTSSMPSLPPFVNTSQASMVRSATETPHQQASMRRMIEKNSSLDVPEANMEIQESMESDHADFDQENMIAILQGQYHIEIEKLDSSHLQLINYTLFSNLNDFFFEGVNLAFKAHELAKELLDTVPKGEMFSRTLDGFYRDSFYSLVMALSLFEEEFPKIHASRHYDEALNAMKDVIRIYEEIGDFLSIFPFATYSDSIDERYAVYRSPKEFTGTKMIIGCGFDCAMCEAGPHDPEEFFLVDKSDTVKPDIVADYYSGDFWQEFGDNTFSEIQFEGIEIMPWSPSLSQILRILQKGGSVTLGLTKMNQCAFEQPADIQNYFLSKGFSDVRVIESDTHNDTLVLIK